MYTNPFTYVERKEKFNNTFLKVVTLRLEYDDRNETYEIFRDFLKSYAKLELTKERYETKNLVSIVLRAEEGNVILKFEGNRIEFLIGNGIYKGFSDNLKDFVVKFAEFLVKIKADVSDITIIKLNEWVFNKNEAFSKDLAFELIYSSNIRNMIPFKDDDFAIKIFNLDEGRKAVVRYGVLHMDDDQHETLILDTSVKYTKAVQGNELKLKCEELNQDLYNMFRWSVTNLVIEAMKSDISE